jgi:hypothetical protein
MTTVEGPAFSIYGVSTEKKLTGALTAEQIDNGFVNRFLFFNVGRGAPAPVDPQYRFTQMPAWLEAALKAKADWVPMGPIDKEGIIFRRVYGEVKVVKGFRRIGWAKGVKKLWLEWVTEIRGMPSTDDRALWIRAPENALRLATVEAYWRGADIVDIEGWRWAKAVVDLGMRQLVKALHQNMSEDLAAADLADAIRAEFQKEKWQVLVKGPLGDQQLVGQLTHGQIRKLLYRFHISMTWLCKGIRLWI